MNRRDTSLYRFLKKCEEPPRENGFWLTMNLLFNTLLVCLGRGLLRFSSLRNRDKQYVITSILNVGDLLFLYEGMNELQKQNGFKNLTVIADSSFEKALSGLEIEEKLIVPYWKIMLLDKAVQQYPEKYPNLVMSMPWCFLGAERPSQADLPRSLPCRLSPETRVQLFPEPAMRGQTVILSPYEKSLSYHSLELLPWDFWVILAEKLKEQGFYVLTNCNGRTEKPVDGTPQFFPQMGELAGAVDYAGYCVSVRSGFTDWISAVKLKGEVVLYPTQKYLSYYSIKRNWGKTNLWEYVYGDSSQSAAELAEAVTDYLLNGEAP